MGLPSGGGSDDGLNECRVGSRLLGFSGRVCFGSGVYRGGRSGSGGTVEYPSCS